MKQVGKYTGTFFLWLAMLVLLAHSVVPHDHHADVIACKTECSHDEVLEIEETQLNGSQHPAVAQCGAAHKTDNCQACHFNATTTTELVKLVIHSSLYALIIQQVFIFQVEKTTFYGSWPNHYSYNFLSYKTSRGPPSLK
jgi:hypothetical protein